MLTERSITIATQLVADCNANRHFKYARERFHPALLQIMAEEGVSNVMELGAGRSPSFDQQTVENLGVTYCSNDISQRELDLGPKWTAKAAFDLCSRDSDAVAAFAQSSDVVFSRMLMEHVPDFRAAYRNIATILRPGGISIAFHPVLYSVPFVINRVLPETLSARILRAAFPHRNDNETPKFPAVYSGCRVAQSVRDEIMAQGFQAVWHVPFWGHGYYRKLPVLRDVHAKLSDMIERRGLTQLATYAFTIAVK